MQRTESGDAKTMTTQEAARREGKFSFSLVMLSLVASPFQRAGVDAGPGHDGLAAHGG